VKKEYHKERLEKTKERELEAEKKAGPENETVREYLEEKEKYKEKKLPKTDKAGREAFTLKLLEKFKSKLSEVRSQAPEEPTDQEEDDNDPNWLSHKLDFSEKEEAVLAKDASTKQDDWFDIYDPRNPINKRKRHEDEEKKKKIKK
jgi:peptidyl-prolyl cis-trans isomerase SDCCAG10